MVPICLTHQGASTDTQHDLVGSPRDLDLRLNFDLDLLRSPCICFDVSRREKHDGAKIIALPLLGKNISVKNISPKRSFWHLMTPGAKTIYPSSNLRARCRKSAQKVIACFFGSALAAIVSGIVGTFMKNIYKWHILTFHDL